MGIFGFAFKNLKRRTFRSVAVLGAVALVSAMIFSSTVLSASVRSSLELGMERLGADIMVVPAGYEDGGKKVLLAGEPNSFYMDGENYEAIRGVEGVAQGSRQLFMSSAILECCSMPTVLLVGYDPETDFTIAPWKRYEHKVLKEELDPVTVGAQTLYASESPHMTFYGKTFNLASSLAPTGMGFLDYSIFMSMDAARDMIEGSKTKSTRPLNVNSDQISSVLVRVVDGTDVRGVAKRIEDAVPGVKALVTKDLIASVKGHAKGSLWSLFAAGGISWIMMILFVGTVFTLAVHERRREIGILRAMGATEKYVFRLILSESLVLSVGGGLLGIMSSSIVLYSFRNLIIQSFQGVPLLWPGPVSMGVTALVCLGFAVASAGVAASVPASVTSRAEPYSAIRWGR